MKIYSIFIPTLLGLAATTIQPAAADCSNINKLVEQGVAPTSIQLLGANEPLSCVVPKIQDYQAIIADPNLSIDSPDIQRYLALTAAAIRLAEGNFQYVQDFRLRDSVNTAEVLAAGARHPERAIRINSARLLANVVDNSTLCVVLDYLHADVKLERDHYTVKGRANLLGVAKAAASWIGTENQLALKTTLEDQNTRIRAFDDELPGALNKTKKLVDSIENRLSKNDFKSVNPALIRGCTERKPKFWDYKQFYKMAE